MLFCTHNEVSKGFGHCRIISHTVKAVCFVVSFAVALDALGMEVVFEFFGCMDELFCGIRNIFVNELLQFSLDPATYFLFVVVCSLKEVEVLI